MADATDQHNASSPLFGVASAAEQYNERLASCEKAVSDLSSTDRKFVRLRIAGFIVTLATSFVCLGESSVSWGWLSLPLAGFVSILVFHGRLLARLRTARAREHFYQDALARLTPQWKQLDSDGTELRDSQHAWSNDLDLFGPGSLFQRMDCCRTLPGKRLLAEWMTTVPAADEIRIRQSQTDSLSNNLPLREDLATIGGSSNWTNAEQILQSWIQLPAQRIPRYVLVLSGALGLVGVFCLILVLLQVVSLSALLLVLALQAPLMYLTRDQIRSVSAVVDDAEAALKQLSLVIREFEQSEFSESSLLVLQSKFIVGDHQASEEIHRLSRAIRWLDNSLRNQFFAPIAWMCGLLVILTDRIERWRDIHGQHVSQWMETVARFEALMSVAAFNFDNSDYNLPEVTDTAPEFTATQLGHPLLPRNECIRNDVQLTKERPLILISGSNMSGKSTLLRSIGVNTVLAFCGSRVNAETLTVFPFQIGTAMRVSDSLQEGKSLFFSVVQRLKTVVDLTTSDQPVLFLLDEILHGTNSHDRRRGAEAVIRTLVSNNALGIVTTHDLALTRIVETMDGKACNKHFEDQIIDGQMTFDYQLREGIVERSNAIELMRMMGLDI